MSVVARRYYLRGRAALERADTDQAIEALASAVDLVPHFIDARLAYSVALARIGDTPRAAQTLRSGIAHARTDPARSALYLQLGEVSVQGGDFLAAIDSFDQAAMHPAWVKRAAAGRARAMAKMGRHGDALAQLLLAVGRPPPP